MSATLHAFQANRHYNNQATKNYSVPNTYIIIIFRF